MGGFIHEDFTQRSKRWEAVQRSNAVSRRENHKTFWTVWEYGKLRDFKRRVSRAGTGSKGTKHKQGKERGNSEKVSNTLPVQRVYSES